MFFISNKKFSRHLLNNNRDTMAFYLSFANNTFTGPILRSIDKASKLLKVLFLNNCLTGYLPYKIGSLKHTRIFYVSCNKLTVLIPLSFACLANMNILNLAKNKFYEQAPEVFSSYLNWQTYLCHIPISLRLDFCAIRRYMKRFSMLE